jgi:hypothetical protein
MTEPGMRVGAYQLLQRLGCGASSEVWKAMRVPTGETAAVKIADRDTLHAPPALDHPNIVRIIDVHPDHLVMELVEGGSLRDRLGKGPLPFDRAAEIARAVAAGLAYAHEHGVAHYDLKPENILIGDTAKISDFGSGRLPKADELSRSIDPSHESLVVTLPYMAPEIRAGRGSMASDIYSFGIVFYEMLTGTLPVGAFRYPSELFPEIPSAIDDLLHRCLMPDPAQRFAHAMELKTALDTALDSPTHATPLQVRGIFEIRSVRELVNYAVGSVEQWDEIKAMNLADWFRTIRRFDLARRVEESRTADRDAALEALLESTGYFHPPVVDVDVDGDLLDLGAVPRGRTRPFHVRVIKRGRGYLSAQARTPSLIVSPQEIPIRLSQVDREHSETLIEFTLNTERAELYREFREVIDIGSRRVVVRFTVDPREADIEVHPPHLNILAGRSTILHVRNIGDQPARVHLVGSATWLQFPSVVDVPAASTRDVRVSAPRREIPKVEGLRADAEIRLTLGSREILLPVTVMAAPRFDVGFFILGLFMGFLPVLGEILFIGALIQAAWALAPSSDEVRRSQQLLGSVSFLLGMVPGMMAHLALFLS